MFPDSESSKTRQAHPLLDWGENDKMSRHIGTFITTLILVAFPVSALHQEFLNKRHGSVLPIPHAARIYQGCRPMPYALEERMFLRGGNEGDGGEEGTDNQVQEGVADADGSAEEYQANVGTQDNTEAEIASRGGYRAAFGIVVGTESGASFLNMGLTAAMAALMTISRKHFLQKGNVNPRVLDAFIVILAACTVLQLPMFILLAFRDLWKANIIAGTKDFVAGLVQDMRGQAPDTPEEQERRYNTYHQHRSLSSDGCGHLLPCKYARDLLQFLFLFLVFCVEWRRTVSIYDDMIA